MLKPLHAFLALTSLILLACNQEKQIEYKEEGTPISAQGPNQGRRMFQYETRLNESAASEFNLADATAYTMTLSECASSHAETITEANIYLELYEFDRNCVVKLTQFTLNGKVYTPKAGSTFTTWDTGDTATFEVLAANPVDELGVEVISTIANPVVAAGTIHYQFSEITKGADSSIGEGVVRESQIVSVDGQAAPDFLIRQIKLVDITGTGNGEFQIQFECNGEDVSGAAATLACYDVRLSDIHMVLVEDTFGGNLTQSDLNTIYTAASGGKQIDMATDAFAPTEGSPALPHGGFISAPTGDADVLVLAGNKPIVQHPNMILILKAGPSYQYFNLDVTLITQDNSAP